MDLFTKLFLIVGILFSTSFSTAKSLNEAFPNCDGLIQKFVLDQIGTKTKKIEYRFTYDPNPTNYSIALAYPNGCPGKVKFELDADRYKCAKPLGSSKPSIIKSATISDECK